MADNDRLSTLHSVQLSGTTKSWADALNDNFAELDERKTDIGDTSTLVHDGSYVHANDSTITIQKNGTDVDSFTTNAASGKSINITLAKGDVGLGNVDNVQQYSASNPPPYPVNGVTVNGTSVVDSTTKIAAITVPTTPQEVGADPAGTASSAVSTHDASSSAHSDIRSAVSTAQQKADDAYSLAEGREKAVAYNNYSAAVTAFNAESSAVLKIGDNIYIKTVEVPDLWVYDVLGSKVTYTYTTDAAIVSAIQTNGYVDIGWYRLAQLETSKVDLSGYVPTSRTVNSKALSSDITLDASDVGALASSTKYGASLSVSGRSVQLKDQDGNNLGSAIQTQDTTYSAATQSADGLMSSTDKTKLDGISSGANKVEASQTNGNIKIDGVETTVYTLPAIDQVKEYSFISDDTRWGSAVGGIYTLTINASNTQTYVAGSRPFVCYNGDGEQVMATIGYTGSAITIKTDTKFAGKVLAI